MATCLAWEGHEGTGALVSGWGADHCGAQADQLHNSSRSTRSAGACRTEPLASAACLHRAAPVLGLAGDGEGGHGAALAPAVADVQLCSRSGTDAALGAEGATHP